MRHEPSPSTQQEKKRDLALEFDRKLREHPEFTRLGKVVAAIRKEKQSLENSLYKLPRYRPEYDEQREKLSQEIKALETRHKEAFQEIMSLKEQVLSEYVQLVGGQMTKVEKMPNDLKHTPENRPFLSHCSSHDPLMRIDLDRSGLKYSMLIKNVPDPSYFIADSYSGSRYLGGNHGYTMNDVIDELERLGRW